MARKKQSGTRETIHGMFEIREPHELPTAMMRAIKGENLAGIISDYKTAFPDLKHDYLRDYFQENQPDRSNLMQDYAPESVCRIVAGITGKRETIADICAGTGSLTLSAWQENPDAVFYCYELSSASLPFLLFNLLVRGVDAFVIHGDVLTQDYETVYHCHSGQIEEVEGFEDPKVDAVITNPPYGLKWSGSRDFRFGSYDTPPKGAADFAFFLIGLNMLKEGGTMTAILPHGVLFRGNQEEKIRKELLEDHALSAVIGLPPALFANTQIPVCLLVTGKADDGVFVVDASEEMKKQPKQNIMEAKHIEAVLSAFRMRRNIDKLASLATYEEIKENDWNLNIPRYVETWELEELEPAWKIMERMIECEKEIKANKEEMLKQLESMVFSGDIEEGEDFKKYVEKFREWVAI